MNESAIAIDCEKPDQPYQYSGVSQSKGVWSAFHGGRSVSYSATKFGPECAERMARKAWEMMVAGGDPDTREDAMGRYSLPFDLAAKLLQISLLELRSWLVTGEIRGFSILPPRRAGGRDFIAGYELDAAKERLVGIKPPR